MLLLASTPLLPLAWSDVPSISPEEAGPGFLFYKRETEPHDGVGILAAAPAGKTPPVSLWLQPRGKPLPETGGGHTVGVQTENSGTYGRNKNVKRDR